MQQAIADGCKKIYFPDGTFTLSVIISESNIEIFGAGIGKTIFKPKNDTYVFRILRDVVDIMFVTIHDALITNIGTGFINVVGIKIDSNGGVLTQNDNHSFDNLEIYGFKYNMLINDRTIYTKFDNCTMRNALIDNIHTETNDYINALEFNFCRFWNAQRYGVFINGGANACTAFKFINCSIESNGLDSSIEDNGGVYLYNVANISFDTTYIENNAIQKSDGRAIIARGNQCQGLTINTSLVWGSPIALDLVCSEVFGSAFDSRIAGRLIYTGLNAASSFSINNCNTTHLIEETIGNVSRKSFQSLTPLIMSSKWFSVDNVSVKNVNILINSNTHTLTTLVDGTIGQIIYIINAGNVCTVAKTGNISLSGGANALIGGDLISLQLLYNGTRWVEISRS